MSEERLLVIAFQFPPYAEVGSKRWTKLTKYLARAGVRVHVLTVGWGPETDDAMREVTGDRISVTRIPCPGFRRWRRRIHGPDFTGRAMNALRRRLLSLLDTRGWADDGRFWGPLLLPAAERAIDDGFTTVVATGAPFWSGVWAARLKARRPEIRLIQEFRDPWADLPAMAFAPPAAVRRVESLEAELVDAADLVVTVTEALSATVSARHPAARVLTVRNGFDPEDFSVTPARRPRPFHLLHAGNLFAGRKEPLIALLEAVRSVRGEMPELTIASYGGFPGEVRQAFDDLVRSGVLSVHTRVSGPEIIERMDDAFACLHFNARGVPFALSTKIYEYAYAGRPVISVNYGGISAEFVTTHQLGWNADADDTAAVRGALRAAYALWKSDPSAVSQPVGLKEYEYASVAERYRQLLFESTD